MRLGIGSYTYPWAIGIAGHPPDRPLTAADLLKKAADLGVGVVQICDNLPLDRMGEQDLNALAADARARGIAIEVGTRDIRPDHLRIYLALARRLGSPILRVVVDAEEHRPSPDEVVALLTPLLPEFERAGVCLAIENHDRFAARVLAGIVDRLGSAHVGVCLDTVNSFGALEGPEAVVEALAPFTVNLHVKDFEIHRAGSQLGFTVEGRPAGQGRLNVPWLLERLRAAGRDPNAILELWTPPAADLPATIAREDTWARESIAALRQWIRT